MRDSHAGGKKSLIVGRHNQNALLSSFSERCRATDSRVSSSQAEQTERLKRGVSPRRMGQVEEVIFPTALECCLEQSQKGVLFFQTFRGVGGGGGAHQIGRAHV